MTYQEFYGKLQIFKEVQDAIQQTCESFGMEYPEKLEVFFDNYLELLSESLGIPYEGDDFTWWIYETNYGKYEPKIYDKDDNCIYNLETLSSFWNYLKDTYPEGNFN